MLNPAWLDAMAEAFWGAAGGAPPAFPRGLEPAILYATPLAIVSLPRLRPRAVDAWLARHGAAPVLDEGDGRLHACLVVAAVARTLAADFGLPAAVAEGYAARLLRHLGAEPSFAEWLGLPGSGPSGGPGR